jgi:hypothetical protein
VVAQRRLATCCLSPALRRGKTTWPRNRSPLRTRPHDKRTQRMQLRYCVGTTDAKDQRRKGLCKGPQQESGPPSSASSVQASCRSPPVKAECASRHLLDCALFVVSQELVVHTEGPLLAALIVFQCRKNCPSHPSSSLGGQGISTAVSTQTKRQRPEPDRLSRAMAQAELDLPPSFITVMVSDRPSYGGRAARRPSM